MSNAELKKKLYDIIFGTEPGPGRIFDVALIVIIIASILALFLDSVASIHEQFGDILFGAELLFTVLFTLEYLARIYCSPNRRAYLTSFFGIIDLIATLPTYLAMLVPGAQHLLVIRIFRVLRVFRILKLFHYVAEANVLMRSLVSARHKISVFLMSVTTLVIVFGSLMYLVEGPENGFSSLPRSIYWAIVTVTTVGYGDIAPHTTLGQAIAALAMITSYAIIAIPTGILSAELIYESQRKMQRMQCPGCARRAHDSDARFCKHCGTALPAAAIKPEATASETQSSE
ncbi:ion transporter [Spongiibacter sp. KMU-158]|uniref:Ion transporter n=1 Tax=Spongiibacter pelagi TaxID=2760804 RepID=A0A927C2D9_9GAMM|nr:ion transporter [Spongiibacter pelagi]MBD2858531.1 ion transporter [Spongiibacter pelagi]